MAENVGTGQAPHATIAKDTGGTAAYPQKSHAIRLGDDSTKSENGLFIIEGVVGV